MFRGREVGLPLRSGWSCIPAPRLRGGGLLIPRLLHLLPNVRPAAPGAPPACGQGSLIGRLGSGPQTPHRRRNSSGGASSDIDAYGAIPAGKSQQSLLGAVQGPA